MKCKLSENFSTSTKATPGDQLIHRRIVSCGRRLDYAQDDQINSLHFCLLGTRYLGAAVWVLDVWPPF